REHRDRADPGAKARHQRRRHHHQQRIEPQQEAGDDDENAEEGQIFAQARSPNPPPPGVSITNLSPAAMSAAAVALSVSMRPSARTTRFTPGLAGSPPFNPAGGTRRRLERMFARIGSRKRTCRSTPSPPLCRPSPPEPRRIAKRSSSTGKRVSKISGSVR